jgi:hypothetical protein
MSRQNCSRATQMSDGTIILPKTSLPYNSGRSALPEEPSQITEPARYAREQLLAPLPNDLTRLIYLTSIRDYNSGAYLHHVLSRRYGLEIVDKAFHMCHEEVFVRLLAASVEDYVRQIVGYIRFARADQNQFIGIWKVLQAYRAAIPYPTSTSLSEVFFLNVTMALSILESSKHSVA